MENGPVLALSTDVENGFSTINVPKGLLLQGPQQEVEAKFQALGRVAHDGVAQGQLGQLQQRRQQTAAF